MAIISSCKKDDPAPSVVGFWKGNYTANPSTTPINYVFFLFRSDGTLTEWYGLDTTTSNRATSDYIVSGNNLSWSSDYDGGGDDYGYAVSMSSDGDSIKGTWGYVPSSIDGGAIAVGRQ
jgi:hypothetical protein